MADSLTSEQRHLCMSRVKGKNTKPEILVRKALFSRGFRYRIHVRSIIGNPDIVLRKYHTVVFINGCFWHSHPNCKQATIPQSNNAYWKAKIERNVCRDEENRKKLEEDGWTVLVVWECELKKACFEDTINKLVRNIRHE